MSLTEADEALYRRCGPGLRETVAALNETALSKGVATGTLRWSVPQVSVPFVAPLVLVLRTKCPDLKLEACVEDRFVDLIRDGFDGVRRFESTEKDMVAVRGAPPFRFVVVGAPTYLRHYCRPEQPRELLKHDGAQIGHDQAALSAPLRQHDYPASMNTSFALTATPS